MEYVDFNAQYKALKRDIDLQIQRVIQEAKFINGPEVEALEQELAEAAGVKYCLTAKNSTDAMFMALKTFGIGPGDAVFMPSFASIGTRTAIALTGASVIFTDVSEDSYTMDTDSLRDAILSVKKDGRLKPRVIIPVDRFGLPAHYPLIESIAIDEGLLVCADSQESFGASIGRQLAVSFADIAITSFYPTNPLGAYGDGAALFTDDEDYYHLLVSIRDFGFGANQNDYVRIGTDSYMDTIQAAILLPKLEAFFSYEFDKRNELANYYSSHLPKRLTKPYIPKGYISSYAKYIVLAPSEASRKEIVRHLNASGIPSSIYEDLPLHRLSLDKEDYAEDDFLVSVDLARRAFTLPIHAYMKQADSRTVISALHAAVKQIEE